MSVSIVVQAEFKVNGIDRDELTAAADQIMEYLVDAEPDYRTQSTAVSVDLGTSKVLLELVCSAENFKQAELVAKRLIESAIKSTGGNPRDIHDPVNTTTGPMPAHFASVDERYRLVDA